MADFTIETGSIFDSAADAIIVTVNCVGFMGKGMALECALRYPDVERDYKALCSSGKMEIGIPQWVSIDSQRSIVLFPTKRDFKHPSKMQFITSGLDQLAKDLESRGIKSVALPHLGSELGGLDWNDVELQVRQRLSQTQVHVELWSFNPLISSLSASELLKRIAENRDQASAKSGLNRDLIDRLLYQFDAEEIPGFASMLAVPGIGKAAVRKLISFRESEDSYMPSLFD
jgi:O-acetyl-ADP-ribose deacetylase (regulator of RNase III)